MNSCQLCKSRKQGKINYTMLYLKFINTAPPTCEGIPRFLYQNGFSNVVEHDSKGWSPMCYACLQDVKRVVKQWNTVRFTGETCVFSLLGLKKREFKLENRFFTWFSSESLVNFYQKTDYDYIYIYIYSIISISFTSVYFGMTRFSWTLSWPSTSILDDFGIPYL